MFKKILNRWFRNFLVLLGLSYFYPGFQINGGFYSILIAALTLYFIQTFLHPFIKVITLPINIITLGVFDWLIVSTHLILIAYFLKDVEFLPYNYSAFKFLGINFSQGSVNLIFSIIIATLLYKYLRKVILFLT